MKQYVFKYKVNPEVLIVVTVLQDYSIKNKFPTAGYINIFVPNCYAVF
jgi:hypothetical protein